MAAQNGDALAAERLGIAGRVTAEDIIKLTPVLFELGGQFLMDPNEFNGWGTIGPIDDTNNQDLGNVAAAVSRTAGGLIYPFDVQPIRMFAWHYNSNNSALPWGWRIAVQEKNAASNTVTTTDMIRECVGTGATAVAPRDYGNTVTQQTDIDLSGVSVVPAGQVIVLGVESPTATTTNYYVRVMAGYIQFARV